MLIIGRRGKTDDTHEKSPVARAAYIEATPDIVEFDVHVTRDGEPVVVHDSALFARQKNGLVAKWKGHASLQQAIEKGHAIAPLEDVIDALLGKVMLNLEIKSIAAATAAAQLVSDHIQTNEDWQAVLFSSRNVAALRSLRTRYPQAELALLHDHNPFAFIAHYRSLNFAAVGWHRLHVNPFALEIARQLNIFTYVYTVNRPSSAKRFAEAGYDGVMTDTPRRLMAALTKGNS